MNLMRIWVGLEERRRERNASCVVINASDVLSECPSTVLFMCKLQELLGDSNVLKA